MRTKLAAAYVVMGGLLLAGCSEPAAPEARAAPVGTKGPTAAPTAGSGPSGSASRAAPASGSFATPLPSGSSMDSSADLEGALNEEDSTANTAYIDNFLAERWKSGTKPSTLGVALPGDCLFFDWEYSSGPTQTALFAVPCTEPHEGEVFGVITHANQPYPGEQTLSQEATRLCADFLEHHPEKLAPGHSFRPLSPTDADWKAGERNSVCLYSPPGLLSERSHFGS